jgi:hypothetical protein
MSTTGASLTLTPEAILVAGADGLRLARLALVFTVGTAVHRVVAIEGAGPRFVGRTADPAVTVALDLEGDRLRVELVGPFAESDAIVYFQGSTIDAQYGRTFVPDCDCRTFLTRDREEIFLTSSGMILQKRVNKRDLWMIAPPPHVVSFGEAGRGWFGLSIPEAMPVVHTRIACAKGSFDLTFATYSASHDGGRLPRVYIDAALPDGKAILDAHRRHAQDLGLIVADKRTHAWWYDPIYCTWGDQCYLEKTSTAPVSGFAPRCTFSSELMLRWAARVRTMHAGPVTYIVDAGWYDHLGDFMPNPTTFGTVEAFREAIARLKADGFRVVLWYTPYWTEARSAVERDHPEYLLRRRDGTPYRDDDGRGMLDFSRADVRDFVRSRIAFMLRTLDADGFKIDMNYVHPLMQDVTMHDSAWGFGDQLVLQVTRFIHGCAVALKPDAFLTISGAESYLQPYASSVRLNDLFEFDDPRAWYKRAELVLRLMPDVPIDVDGWPSSLRKLREYWFVSAVYGAPVTYSIEAVDIGAQPLGEVDLNRMASVWHVYSQAPCAHGMRVTVDDDSDTFVRRGPDGRLQAMALQKCAFVTLTPERIFVTANRACAVAIPVESGRPWTSATRVHRDGRRAPVPVFQDGDRVLLSLEDAGEGILCYEIGR